ncbi:MAG: hypothetical protein F4107_10905 [Gemmatimonadetes bacterium]|nr:hypothetical protein [Gemmatimonadota bacterium]MYI66420.1 hypothetical protein [Gemmatimonadota bacterium]
MEDFAKQAAWGTGYNDGNDGKPSSWPDADTLPDYEAGHEAGDDDRQAGLVQMGQYLRGAFATLERKIDKRGAEVAEKVQSEAGEAAVDIIEDLAVMFRELVAACDRGDGPEATMAVRDTFRQVNVIGAAEVAIALPPDRDGTMRGLARQIHKKRAQLNRLEAKLPQQVPPAFDWTARKNAETLTDPRAATLRRVRRDLDALVHAWDVL